MTESVFYHYAIRMEITDLMPENDKRECPSSNITVLCKVIDNYGDIGVAHRLCMELLGLLGKEYSIRLVTNSLTAYHAIIPEVRLIPYQIVNGITVLDWDDNEMCLRECALHPIGIILQCFQCGYPKWLEDMLFSTDGAEKAESKNIFDARHEVTVIDIDYLTAESWADDFHKMKLLTRSSFVHKYLFMPGFTASTGGLLLKGRTPLPPCPYSMPSNPYPLHILVFGYSRDYTPLVRALSRVCNMFPIKVYVASGAGQKAFLDAHKTLSAKSYPLIPIPFLRQDEWDKMLMSVDIAFVRGEDSLAGAALAGIPYVWEAYKQEGGAQIKKASALLERMKPYFTDGQYDLLHSLWMLWNGGEGEDLLYEFILRHKELKTPFARYADSLVRNGDLAENLVKYISLLMTGMPH